MILPRQFDAAELEEMQRNLDAREAFEESEEARLDREWEKADLPPIQHAVFLATRRRQQDEHAARSALYPAAERRVRAQAINPPRRLT